jgi:hypothetical protein
MRLLVAIAFLAVLLLSPVHAANLVQNPGFENPDFENDWALNWSHSHNWGNAGTEEIASSGCYSGTSCLEMINGDSGAGDVWQITIQEIGNLIPGKYYKLSVMFKTSENHSVFINLYDANWKNAAGVKVAKSFTAGQKFGNNNWMGRSRIVWIPLVDDFGESTVDHSWWVYLYGHAPVGNFDPIYYDDIWLEEYNPNVENFGGCVNNGNSKCLDLGSPADEFNSGVLGANKSEGDINYRELTNNPNCDPLYIDFPEFNTDPKDPNRLPLTDMLLEIKYKDVLESNTPKYADGDGQATKHRVFVDLKYNFENKDPYNYENKYEYTNSYASIGEFNDGQWKVAQIPIQKTRFTLLRAIGGLFTIRIRPPCYAGDLPFPIDYVSLKSISHEDYLKINEMQREMLGFYQGNIPKDEPSSPVIYPDPRLVTFTRDIMMPVYNSTKPKQEELTEKISGFSTLGEIEPLSFGIYSETGIGNLNFVVSDLVMGGYNIPKDSIKIFEVVEAESWANVYTSINYLSYISQPDRIEEISSFGVGKNSSKRVWIKIHVPGDIPSGVYTGAIDIKQGNNSLKSIGIDFTVYAIKLDEPKSLNSVYTDPYYKIYSSNNSEVFRFYREIGLVPFNHASYNSAIKDSSGTIVDYDLTGFENRIDKMISEGVVKDRMILELTDLWQRVYSDVYETSYGTSSADSDLYSNLSDPKFVGPFSKVVTKLIEVGKARNRNISFIFSAGDEPGVRPDARIVADRIFTIIKKRTDGNTTITYYTSCEKELVLKDDEFYKVPNSKIPRLTNLVDYKIWAPVFQGAGYLTKYSNYGYYTTYSSNVRNPIYNRFLLGALALKTDAVAISVYAMGDWIRDPWNDFDKQGNYISPFTYPDFLLAYPSWDGKLIPTMASEGLREGIKDDKYFETLKRLIRENPANPASAQAQNYLNSVKEKISPEYWDDYVKSPRDRGSYESILQSLSKTNDAPDFEAFTTIRTTVLNYIAELNEECINPTKMGAYISQWKRGEISMLALMQKLKRWKAGTGCPTPA